MSKGKLQKFAEMETFPNVFQYPFAVLKEQGFPLKGRWHADYFGNDNPITLELGCGKGEYTVGLARQYPDRNFIGIDIKGARMYTGAKQAVDEGLTNVAFLRTHIEFVEHFFAADEVEQLWLTFSDPQMKNPRKRLTSTYFLNRYRHFLVDGGLIHVKTDSRFLYTYTRLMAEHNHLPVPMQTDDLYASHLPVPPIQTYYEQQWLSRGITIKYLCLQLPREGDLTESGAEIPLDDYRSYHRNKRSSKDTAQ